MEHGREQLGKISSINNPKITFLTVDGDRILLLNDKFMEKRKNQ